MKKNITWVDRSENIGHGDWIVRTHFYIGKVKWSVVNGFGPYGGYYPEPKNNPGLLELLTDEMEEDIGWLTAEQIMRMVENDTN